MIADVTGGNRRGDAATMDYEEYYRILTLGASSADSSSRAASSRSAS